ncbi:hypothetical protein [Epilithonimonas vandammei]|uniref:hypothetical protein n=1 Tax=Epilithonimonas vandammei TaxID=2487072 RepID=UPI0028A87D7A|nr:hypothetical protein [Epilithonimonas vandammei]
MQVGIRVSAIGNIFYQVKPGTVASTQAVDDVNNRTISKSISKSGKERFDCVRCRC